MLRPLALLLWFWASFALAAVDVQLVTTPYVRADHPLNQMRVDPKGRFVAYVGEGGRGLRVLDLKTKNIHLLTEAQVGLAFFWSPDGYRLFFRELVKTRESPEPRSVLKAFDCVLARAVVLDELPFATGIPTFDPRDLRLHLLSSKGIRTKRIYFPDERLARWQVAQRHEDGKWLATQGGMLWVTQGGYAMRRLEDDGSALDSFDISPDGQALAWATKAGRLYVSRAGKKPQLIGHGRDPRWHPEKPLLVFAGARMVGNTAVSYDLRIAEVKERGGVAGKFLTASKYSNERHPHWHPSGQQILYTLERTTDLFLMDFRP